MRVLIAEDDPVSRRVLQATLLKWGYEVDVVCDGQEALESLQREDGPRLAVLDWMMPKMDGLAVCQWLRMHNEGPYIYTILLTAKSQRDDLLKGLSAGADDYVIKPFDPGELQLRLRAGKRVLDLQAELISARESVRIQAIRDPLTGLPNRLLFSDRLFNKLAQAERSGDQIAVMFLDLDHFKVINDSLGHNVGDELLKTVANRLSANIRASDTLARMGGDEFTFILGDVSDEYPIVAAQRVLAALSEPIIIEGRELFISGSIGISVYPNDGTDAETLVRNADAAMYRAKERGRNAYHMFTQDLNAIAVERVNIVSGLRRALEREELVLHYQMRMNLKTGVTPGVEALIRWQHPESGLLYPMSFIPLAEDTGLIEPITEWVLKAACQQNKAWQDSGYNKMDVGVNISPRLLHRSDLVHTVENALTLSGLEAKYLNLELTETAIMQNPDQAVVTLTDLKSMGVSISIDDFGVGYSSLGNLRRLPIDFVKIDSSFVRQITTNKDDASIAAAIVAMAHSMNLNVIAEGVETLDQLNFLKSLKCDEIQGYFISRPVSAHEVVHLLKEGNPPLTHWMSIAA
ncbi:MAG: EAL domain-containing protein [Armatimonadota bacterium]|nr:EAL domain-containing protein [bacterium]